MSRRFKLIVSDLECTYKFGPYGNSANNGTVAAAGVPNPTSKPNGCCSATANRRKRKRKLAAKRERLYDAIFCVTSDTDGGDDGDDRSDDVDLSLSQPVRFRTDRSRERVRLPRP